MVAEGAQTLHVLLCGGVLVHVQVHSRRNEHRRFHRQVGGHQHVVGNAVGHLAQRRCRAGSYQHGVGPQSQLHVRMPRAVALCKKLADDGLLRQRRQRDGRYKLLACGCDDHLHLGAPFHQFANDQARLIGCYRARDAQYYFLSFQHIHHLLLWAANLVIFCDLSKQNAFLLSFAHLFPSLRASPSTTSCVISREIL